MDKINSIILSASGVTAVEIVSRVNQFAPSDIEQGLGLLVQIAIAIATIIKLFSKNPEKVAERKEKKAIRQEERAQKKQK